MNPTLEQKVLRIGILGCANIARQFTRDVASSAMVRVVAAASRNAETAAAFAKANGIGRHHGSYEALLSDPDVDAIERAARASIDNAATLEALLKSARSTQAAGVPLSTNLGFTL